MTPKEKAHELVWKISNKKVWMLVPDKDGNSSIYYETIVQESSKELVLIMVEELIESHFVLTTTHDLHPSPRCKFYWKKVKEEIQKL
jgi:hypothetical protein